MVTVNHSPWGSPFSELFPDPDEDTLVSSLPEPAPTSAPEPKDPTQQMQRPLAWPTRREAPWALIATGGIAIVALIALFLPRGSNEPPRPMAVVAPGTSSSTTLTPPPSTTSPPVLVAPTRTTPRPPPTSRSTRPAPPTTESRKAPPAKPKSKDTVPPTRAVRPTSPPTTSPHTPEPTTAGSLP